MYGTSFRRIFSSAINMNIKINPSLHHLKTIYNMNPLVSMKHLSQLSIINNTKLLFKRINGVLISHPVIAGSLFIGFQAEIADLFAQIKIEGKAWNDIDWNRNFAFFSFGSIYCGVITYFILVKCYPLLFPPKGRYFVPLRVLFDVFITTPFLYFPSFYSFKCIVFEKKSFGYKKWKQYQSKYWTQNFKTDVLTSAKVWGPAHIITFTLIPNHLKLLWNAGVSAMWTVILSTMRGSNDDEIDNKSTAKTLKLSEMDSNDEILGLYDIESQR